MPFYVSVGSCHKPIVPGEDFPIKLAKGVAAKLVVDPDEQNSVHVVILDVGNVEVLSGLGFQTSTKTDAIMTEDFILRHSPSGRFAVVIFLNH
jgi:hypothetical protein